MADVIYLVSRFPKVSETFVTDEITELVGRGVSIKVMSLQRTGEPVVRPGVVELLSDARFGRRNPVALVAAQLRWWWRRPERMSSLWWRVMRANASNLTELVKCVVTLLVATEWADHVRTERPQRIHAHWATYPALAGYVLGQLVELPFGFTTHAHDLYGTNTMLAEKVAAADLVVTISDYNRALLLQRLGPTADKVVVIHCGIDPARFPPLELPSGDDRPLELLSVGRLIPEKGQMDLVRACGRLRAGGLAVHCTLVGDGPERSALAAEVAALGLEDEVTIAGWRGLDEVQRLLSASDLFVLASTLSDRGQMEGIPVALMEALASGRPVVSSRMTGIPELVVDGVNGILIPPGDADALVAALQRLATDPALRRALAAAGPPTVREAFNIHATVARLQELFALGGS